MRRENRQLAEQVYHRRMTALAREDHDIPAPLARIGFGAYADWYQEHVSAHKRGHTREAEILAVLRTAFGACHLEVTISYSMAPREYKSAFGVVSPPIACSGGM